MPAGEFTSAIAFVVGDVAGAVSTLDQATIEKG